MKTVYARLGSWLLAACLLIFLAAGGAAAQQLAATPVPVVPKATAGTECVGEPEFMRRNHMDLLTHKRDKTVHDGDRTPQYSLNECIACHAVKGDDGQAVTVSDPRHFCRACHDYAAVKVDCFQCHASRPSPEDAAGTDLKAASSFHASVKDLADYLKEVRQ